MSLLSTLSTSLTGLNAAQRALGVTANNVANANTEGYSRKQVGQSTLTVEGVGQGVRTEETVRIVDEYLAVEVRKQLGLQGSSAVVAELADEIQGRVFGSPGEADRGLSAKFADLAAALEAAAATPESTAAARSLVGELDDMLRQLDGDRLTVQKLRGDVDRRIGATIGGINADIEALDALNAQFVRGLPTAELLDQRDAVLDRLASAIEITVQQKDDQSIAVYTAGGVPLLEQSPSKLIYQPAASVSAATTFGAVRVFGERQLDPETGRPKAGEVGVELVSRGVRAQLTPELSADATPDADQQIVSSLASGRLHGLLQVRDTELPGLDDQLGELASMLRYNLNKAHNAGLPVPLPTDAVGGRTGLDSFDVAAGGGQATGTARVALFDQDGAVVADVALDLATFATPEALAAHLDTQLGASGSAVIDANDRLVITAGLDGGGRPLRLAFAEGDSAITVTDDAGRTRDFGFAHYFGLNDLVVETGSGALAVRADVAADPARLSRTRLDGPAGLPVTGGAGDNRGLLAVADSLSTATATIDRGGIAGRVVDVAGYLADIVATQAASAAQAENRADADRALGDELGQRRSAVSGVNLDEELSRLIVYQRAYSVSARVMTVTNELLEELVNIGR